MKSFKILISGRVQGVSFRNFVKKKAESLNIKGYVRNLEDGRVEVVAEGDEKNLNLLIEECKKGPPLAIVKNVEVIENKPFRFSSFEILY